MFRKYILPYIVWIFYRTLSATWRVRLYEPPEMQEMLANNSSFILAHFHGDELALIHLARRYRIATIASQSKDGELMSKVLHLLGARTSRGSSTRGGVQALKGLISLVKDGGNCSFAVDGPKGPLHKVKPGVFEFSRLLKLPIIAGGVQCDRAWHFPRSWNKTFLPKPFAVVEIRWAPPSPRVEKDVDPRDPQLAQDLEALIHKTKGSQGKVIAE